MGWSAFRKTGLTFHNPNLSVKGYTLFTPLMGDSSYLVNMAGQIVHHWQFDDFFPDHARLLPNGNLMVSGVPKADKEKRAAATEEDFQNDFDLNCLRMGGGYSSLREFNPEGELVWSFDKGGMHHDFFLKANGNVLVPVWVRLPEEVEKRVKGGVRESGAKKPSYMMGDDIIEINREGKELARYKTWQMFDPKKDPIQPLETRWEWTHLNSIDVKEDQLLISCRDTSRVALIDMAKQEIIWKLGEPVVSMQHHATFLDNGNIQIFDNGASKPLAIPFSRIIELNPETNEIAWEYKGQPSEQFFSGHISGAERLIRGNVLICEGTSGRLFEVTRKGEIAWEFINPFIHGNAQGRLFTWVFRAYRYAVNDSALSAYELNPERYKKLNSSLGL